MNAQVSSSGAPPVEMVEFEINGKPVSAPKGSMIIQAVDEQGVPLPRFCYHKKLTIAAACRQCMVEVEMNGRMSPKPLVACATPVAPGMKVFTKSRLAIDAQQSALEFVLINHPLDCPVCDQGGECELQDLTLGFGRSVSRFTERKRTIPDENIGPLVATYMTRCIHCLRCVRFLKEIAGTHEFGDFGKGDRHVIGTYIGSGVSSELSGNIIDVCPVGALTNKVFEFKARPWDLVAKPSIGYHDALGSNLWLHTRRGEVLRTVPRDNEAINECWLSDRDRYSHEGLYAPDRLLRPRVKRDGEWYDTDWESALDTAASLLKSVAGNDVGLLVHPATSNEEGALLKRLANDLGITNIDHRLRQLDFSDAPAAQAFAKPVAEFDRLDAGLLFGCDPQREMPLLHHRLREASKGFVKNTGPANRNRFDITKAPGAALHVVNPVKFDFNYHLASETIIPITAMVDAALVLAAAALERYPAATLTPGHLAEAVRKADVSADARSTVRDLAEARSAVVLVGEAAMLHPESSWLRTTMRFVARCTDSAYCEMPVGANAIGLAQQGVLPTSNGLDARAMFEQPRGTYLLYGAEPPHDFADPARASTALQNASYVIAFTAFAPRALLETADVMLPIALLPEMDATLVNVDGVAQSLREGASPPGDARHGWKALRALGGLLELDGFTFTNLTQLRESMVNVPLPDPDPANMLSTRHPAHDDDKLALLTTHPIYRSDAVLRRATALGHHSLNRHPAARLGRSDAMRLGISDGDIVNAAGTRLPTVIDTNVPEGTVWIEVDHELTATLPPCGTSIEIRRV